MKKNNKFVLAVLMAAVLLVPLFVREVAYAEDDTNTHSMTVSPPFQKILLVPGESYTDTIKISNANSSTSDLEYEMTVGSFSETSDDDDGDGDDYGTVDHVTVSNYNQIMDWISFEKERGRVAPNESDTVAYTINVPKNAPAGGQYATIIVRDITGEGSDNSGNVAIQSIYQFASIVYAEVAGETKEAGGVVSNNVPTLSFSSPLMVSSIVKNEGNVHTDAKYTLQIWPLFSDEEIYSNEEEPMTSLILPETERYNAIEWEEAPMIGIFRVRQTVEIFGDISTVEKIVIICPLWLIIVLVVAIVFVIVWLIIRRKTKK